DGSETALQRPRRECRREERPRQGWLMRSDRQTGNPLTFGSTTSPQAEAWAVKREVDRQDRLQRCGERAPPGGTERAADPTDENRTQQPGIELGTRRADNGGHATADMGP